MQRGTFIGKAAALALAPIDTIQDASVSDPLIDAANKISNSSPAIKAFAQLSAQRTIADDTLIKTLTDRVSADEAALSALTARVSALEASVVTPPLPPPPTSLRVGNGLLLNAQGNTYSTLTDAQHKVFGGIISGSDKATSLTALGAPVHGLLYHTVFECGSSIVWPGGVTAAQAEANGWIYKDTSGNLIKNVSDIANPGLAAYQQAWADNIAPQVAACPGLFLDNCDGKNWWGTVPYINGVPVYDLDVADAMISFFTFLRARFPDVYILCNVGQGRPDRVTWLKRLLPLINGAMYENFDGGTEAQAFAAACVAANKDFWAIGLDSVTDPKSVAAHDLAVKFKAVWDGKGGGFGWGNGSLPADPNWTVPITG